MIGIDEKATGQNIKDLLAEKGVSYLTTSQAIGVDSRTIYLWCNAKRKMTLLNALRLAEFLDCDVDDLVVVLEVD